MDDDAWNDLLNAIEERKVLPIVGPGVTTFGADDQLLGPWLAERLAASLKVPVASLPDKYTLNDVVVRHLMSGGKSNLVYSRLHAILEKHAEKPTPGPTLQRLAEVDGLNLFVTTTFDRLLKQALNSVRYAGRDVTTERVFAPLGGSDEPANGPSQEKSSPYDTQARLSQISSATVLHILGRVAPIAGGFVAWDEDLLDFICKLSSASGLGSMPNLSKDLSDKDVSLLALGLNFSDWLLRLFLRVAWQDRVDAKDLSTTYVAEAVTPVSQDNLVMMWECRSNSVEVLEVEPREFVRELAERWKERRKNDPQLPAPGKLVMPPKMPPNSIFISYVREDFVAVRNLVTRLENRGCIVWLDTEQLKSGGDYNVLIRRYIEKDCCAFISVISENTESQAKAYAHKERSWAIQPFEEYSGPEKHDFYHPVIISQIELGKVIREPEPFQTIGRVQFMDGMVDDDFCDRLYAIQQRALGQGK